MNTFAEQVAQSPNFVSALVLDLVAEVADNAERLARAAARYYVARDYDLPELDTARRALRTQARAAYERVREYAGLVDLAGVLDWFDEVLPPDRVRHEGSEWLRAVIHFGATDDLTALTDAICRMAERGTHDE